jgi:hypothetical protein
LVKHAKLPVHLVGVSCVIFRTSIAGRNPGQVSFNMQWYFLVCRLPLLHNNNSLGFWAILSPHAVASFLLRIFTEPWEINSVLEIC